MPPQRSLRVRRNRASQGIPSGKRNSLFPSQAGIIGLHQPTVSDESSGGCAAATPGRALFREILSRCEGENAQIGCKQIQFKACRHIRIIVRSDISNQIWKGRHLCLPGIHGGTTPSKVTLPSIIQPPRRRRTTTASMMRPAAREAASFGMTAFGSFNVRSVQPWSRA